MICDVYLLGNLHALCEDSAKKIYIHRVNNRLSTPFVYMADKRPLIKVFPFLNIGAEKIIIMHDFCNEKNLCTLC